MTTDTWRKSKDSKHRRSDIKLLSYKGKKGQIWKAKKFRYCRAGSPDTVNREGQI
jgi:hypothetical protein